jgi:hypothetical protein
MLSHLILWFYDSKWIYIPHSVRHDAIVNNVNQQNAQKYLQLQ